MVIIQNSINDLTIDDDVIALFLQNVITDLGASDSELVVRFVDKNEIQDLNKTYRKQDKATNVLSFSSNLPKQVTQKILGDVLICTKIVHKEATMQNKTFLNHLMHIALHGTLHLFGYDHIKQKDAIKMEKLEIEILQKNGINNPYLTL